MTHLDAYHDFLFDTPEAGADSVAYAGCACYANLWEAVCAEPNQPWDYWKLSQHPELTWAVIERLAHKGWNWAAVSQHSGLVFEFVRAHPEKAWDWRALGDHPNISLEDIAAHPEYFWKFRTRAVPMSILKHTPEYKRNIYEALFVPWGTIFGDVGGKWNWGRLSQRRDLTWKDIVEHPEVPWDYEYLTTRDDLTLKIVAKLPEKPWAWRRLTWLFAKKDYGLLLTFPDKPWDYDWLSHQKDLDWDVFWEWHAKRAPPAKSATLGEPDRQAHTKTNQPSAWNYAALFAWSGNKDLLIRLPEVPWDFKKKNLYKRLSWETIQECMEKTGGRLAFPWEALCRRPDVPWGLVMEKLDDWPWCWRSLTGHPGLTLRFYSAHPEFAWSRGWARQRFREVAARRIQCNWRRCVADPGFLVCRRRLMREFEGMDVKG